MKTYLSNPLAYLKCYGEGAVCEHNVNSTKQFEIRPKGMWLTSFLKNWLEFLRILLDGIFFKNVCLFSILIICQYIYFFFVISDIELRHPALLGL